MRPAGIGSMIGVAVLLMGNTRTDASGTGWHLTNIELQVVAHPDSQVLRVAGVLSAAAPIGGSMGPDLVIGPGGMRLDSVESPGAIVEFSSGRDTAHVRFERSVTPGKPIVIRFGARALQPRVARSVAVGADGAFASWFGNWYPAPAAVKGQEPALKAAGSLDIAIPAAWHSLSNGRLVDSTASKGWRRERWESSRPLVWSFIAADYNVSRRHVGKTDVALYLMPRQAAKATAFAAAIPPMVRTLEQKYGAYPFATFGLAAIPAGIAPPGIGGRSEQGYFLAHEHALDGDTVDVALFAHELAHMWWGNTVLSDPPGDDMVDEGMASYGATLVVEARQGRRAAREYMRDGSIPNSAHTFFHLWRIGKDEPLMDDYATLPSYSKGAWFYEMLRERVGDSVFFATLHGLVRERANRSTTLRDIRNAFASAAAAAGLQRFFSDWLDRAGAPVLTVRWSPSRQSGRPVAQVEVTQHTTPYMLPIDIEVESRGGSLRSRITLRDSIQRFTLPALSTPVSVRIDPDHKLMLWDPSYGPIPGVTPQLDSTSERSWLASELGWLRLHYGVHRLNVGVVRNHRVEWTTSLPNARDSLAEWSLSGLTEAATTLEPARFTASRLHSDIQTLASFWSDVLSAVGSKAPTPVRADLARRLAVARDTVADDPFGATHTTAFGFHLEAKTNLQRLSFVNVGDGRTLVLMGYPVSGDGIVIVCDDERVGVGLATQIMQRIAVLRQWPEVPGTR
jgi:hypothetical protein